MSTIVERVTKLVCEQLGVKEEEATSRHLLSKILVRTRSTPLSL